MNTSIETSHHISCLLVISCCLVMQKYFLSPTLAPQFQLAKGKVREKNKKDTLYVSVSGLSDVLVYMYTHNLENMNQKPCQPKYKKPPAAMSAKTFHMLIVVCTLVAKYNPSMSRYSHGADNWIHATMNSIYLFFCLLHARGVLF